jgi:methyl-accepting chemotaxis protein
MQNTERPTPPVLSDLQALPVTRANDRTKKNNTSSMLSEPFTIIGEPVFETQPLVEVPELSPPLNRLKIPAVVGRSTGSWIALIGNRRLRSLAVIVFWVALSVASILAALDLYVFGTNTAKIEVLGNALTHSQRLAKASFGVVNGEKLALEQFKDSRSRIETDLNLLIEGGRFEGRDTLDPLTGKAKLILEKAYIAWQPSKQAADAVLRGELPLMNTDINAVPTDASNIPSPNNTVTQLFNTSSELITEHLESLRQELDNERNIHNYLFWIAVLAAMLAIACAALITDLLDKERESIANQSLKDNEERAKQAEIAKEKAQSEELKVNQINAKNQTAILRLMNELQEIGDGDLTVQATVSEDITGAIADSVNLTVEDLRGLVARINVTAEGVAAATGKTRQTTGMLLELTEQQSAQIQTTGDSVLSMAHNITEVSNRADSSSAVAQKALNASHTGQQAVQASLLGMNGIREQIQDTAKRIKRLGESSQQISEIVDLIGDITEQTNVLALNASIQAASAGEAGRGFTVVAEEVQRLAERSGEATKQIAALVRTIQTDTQDAVSAMERSTHGVVEGAKLTDAAGVAITDIANISQELANIILEIAHTTRGQADQAQTVSQAIKQILSLTERTTLGTRETSLSTDELLTLAQALKNSVARFKVTTA